MLVAFSASDHVDWLSPAWPPAMPGSTVSASRLRRVDVLSPSGLGGLLGSYLPASGSYTHRELATTITVRDSGGIDCVKKKQAQKREKKSKGLVFDRPSRSIYVSKVARADE